MVGEGLGAGAEDEQEAVLEHEADADGGDERRHSRTAPERLIGQTLDGHTQHRADCGGGGNDSPDRQTAGLEEEQRHIGTHHNDIPMGKVDHFGNAVHHRISDGYQRIHAADLYAVDQLLCKVHSCSPLSKTPGDGSCSPVPAVSFCFLNQFPESQAAASSEASSLTGSSAGASSAPFSTRA